MCELVRVLCFSSRFILFRAGHGIKFRLIRTHNRVCAFLSVVVKICRLISLTVKDEWKRVRALLTLRTNVTFTTAALLWCDVVSLVLSTRICVPRLGESASLFVWFCLLRYIRWFLRFTQLCPALANTAHVLDIFLRIVHSVCVVKSK